MEEFRWMADAIENQMVSFKLVVRSETDGIFSVRPIGALNTSMFELKLLCEQCGYRSEFITLSDEYSFPLRRGRHANMKTKCGSCTRTGHITICRRKDGSLLHVDFDGLQPLDGAMRCRSAFRATDMHGRLSDPFTLMVDVGVLKSLSGDPITFFRPVFAVDATYTRYIATLEVFFERA